VLGEILLVEKRRECGIIYMEAQCERGTTMNTVNPEKIMTGDCVRIKEHGRLALVTRVFPSGMAVIQCDGMEYLYTWEEVLLMLRREVE
jgi:hypothetical protein